MAMFLRGSIGIGKAGEMMVLVSISKHMSFGPGNIAEYMLDYFPINAARIVKELQ